MSAPAKIPAMKSDALGLMVNIYPVEGPDGIVLADGATSGEFGKSAPGFVHDAPGKPFPGAILTRWHPDHVPAFGEIPGDVSLPIHAQQGAVDQATPRMRDASSPMPSRHSCPAVRFSPLPYTNSPEHCRPLQLV